MLGIYPNLSNELYHAHDSISRSKLMDFSKSPYNFYMKHLAPLRPKKEATPAMILGTAFHTLILEPNNFHKQYIIEPEKVLLKDVGRDRYDDYKIRLALTEDAIKAGAIPLSYEELGMLLNWETALKTHSQASELLYGATYEQSYFWQDKESGLIVKSRPDILHPNMIVDLKTCQDSSPRAIQNAMVAGGYHLQLAMMREGIRELEGRDIPNCILICIEKVYPYAIGIYVLDEEALEIGRKQFHDLLNSLNHAIVTNEWRQREPQTISLPRWAL